jgi:general L-amino acid transport system permease protein
MRVIIPPLTSQHLTSVKNSSLAVVIGYPDLMSISPARPCNQTGQAGRSSPSPCSLPDLEPAHFGFMNWYNRKMAIVER